MINLETYHKEREEHIVGLYNKYFGNKYTWSYKIRFKISKFIFNKIIKDKVFRKHFNTFLKDLFDLGYVTKEIEVAKDRFKGLKDNYI